MNKRNLSLLVTGAVLLGPVMRPMDAARIPDTVESAKPDARNAEFAHAPKDYQGVKADGFFVVGL